MFVNKAAKTPEDKESLSVAGGSKKPPADNGQFRGGKGSLYEGGVRVPTFVYWPHHIKPGILVEPMHHVDILPTLLYLAQIKNPQTKPLDGKNLWPLFTGQQKHMNRDILINVEAFRGAVRKGKWKLIKVALLPGKVELYDLSTDPGEKHNVAKEHPKVVKELESLLMNYAKQQAPSKWLQVQPQFLGSQGKTILDPSYTVDANGLPHKKN